MEIIALVAAIGTGIETAKKELEFFKDAKAIKDEKAVQEKAAEVRSQLIDLKDQYLTLKEAMQKIQEDNLALTKRVAEREHWGEIRKLLTLKKGVYYLAQKIDGYDEGPFCVRCADKDCVLIHVVAASELEREVLNTDFSCPECRGRRAAAQSR